MRKYLFANFVEIHTPKPIGGSTEGGADVFTVDFMAKKHS